MGSSSEIPTSSRLLDLWLIIIIIVIIISSSSCRSEPLWIPWSSAHGHPFLASQRWLALTVLNSPDHWLGCWATLLASIRLLTNCVSSHWCSSWRWMGWITCNLSNIVPPVSSKMSWLSTSVTCCHTFTFLVFAFTFALSDHLLFLSDLPFLSFLCPWHPYLCPSDGHSCPFLPFPLASWTRSINVHW